MTLGAWGYLAASICCCRLRRSASLLRRPHLGHSHADLCGTSTLVIMALFWHPGQFAFFFMVVSFALGLLFVSMPIV